MEKFAFVQRERNTGNGMPGSNLGYQSDIANTKFYAFQNEPNASQSNTSTSPIIFNGTLYGLVYNDTNATVYYVEYTPV